MTRSALAALNEANPNKLPTLLQTLPLGQLANLAAKSIKAAVASNVIVLPNEAKAKWILSAFATAGTVTGFMTSVQSSATLATTQVKVDAKGDIAFFATDAVTAAEVTYIAVEGDVVTETVVVTAGTGVANSLLIDAAQLIAATVTAGTSLGAKTVVARAASAPSAGNVNLDLDSKVIRFAVADAVTAATVTYVRRPVSSVDANIRASINF